MQKVDIIKGMVAAVMGILNDIFGILAIPIVLLVTCNIIDYVTGILASRFRGQKIESYKGIRGITRKIGMWLLVVVGAVMDKLIAYSVAELGLPISFEFVIAAVVAIWIICNEIISILENLKDMEVPLPDFLIKVTQNIKSQVDVKVDELHMEGKEYD